MLNIDHASVKPVFLHFDEKLFICNNANVPISDIVSGGTYEEYCKYSIGKDFFEPCATNLLSKLTPFPWDGPEEAKPEIERALRLNVKEKMESG